MPTQDRRTQRERREHAEAALISAAAELVVDTGVRSLTLARVGEKAGYSRGIVSHHFGSKQGLLDALARALQSGFVPGLDEQPPGLERLLALVGGYLRALGSRSVTGRAFLLLWAESMTSAELKPAFRDRDVGFRHDIAAEVAAGIADGAVRADADPADVAVAVVGQLRGIGMQYLLDPDAVDLDRLGDEVTDHWRRALAPDEPSAP
ncbi:TetR/AcrR family transcriptional regulator [Saccharopolyspora flava]|uniref:Transcriptional regulator, TetR family n=1 Tax=Saccharopolyspora flava TaxID=95161 RepID=A0A1I6SPA2_9PSEU|nr:TetR/AcrR family transcriptional regulator [Saccharopolyspora flava]SFS78710.1 transcriptional regulator, TetR family [Saccharopolyspora flava]